MKIAYIDGPRLRRALLAGSNSIILNTEALNAINVFPVPDGDTGTNLSNTMRSIAASLGRTFYKDAGSVLRQVARSAIEGARGNSGAIFAQFLQGLAQELGSDVRIGAKRLAQAALAAAEKTKTALSSPREGTILTVLHDWARALYESAARSDDIFQVFLSGLAAARTSLEKTRYILPEMRRAGVVDAGAKGFVHLLDGMAELLKPGRSFRQRLAARRGGGEVGAGNNEKAFAFQGVETEKSGAAAAGGAMGIEDFHRMKTAAEAAAGDDTGPRYCAEALLFQSALPADSLRAALSVLGDSLVVAGDSEFARIHIHSDRPSAVFDLLESKGRVEQHKVDDMRLQRRLGALAADAGTKRRCAVIVDTGCDLPADYMLDQGIIKIPALITLDGRTRPDGPALNLEAMHAKMRHDKSFLLSTSQPPESAFDRAFSLALAHADEALYIGLSSALSGTFQAGENSAKKFDGKIACFDSKTVTAGIGAFAAMAQELAARGASASEIAATLERRRAELKMFVAVPDLTNLIRTGRLKGLKSLLARRLGLRPLLGTDAKGKAVTRGFYVGRQKTVQALFAKLRASLGPGSAWDIHIVHVAAEKEAAQLAKLCESHLGPESEIYLSDMGPLLAPIGWLGALGIAALPRA